MHCAVYLCRRCPHGPKRNSSRHPRAPGSTIHASFPALRPALSAPQHVQKTFFGTMPTKIWTYEGRHVSNPRFQNLRAEYLSGRAISLSEDAVAILDRASPRCIRVCDVSTGRPLADGKASEVAHDCEVVRSGGKGRGREHGSTPPLAM